MSADPTTTKTAGGRALPPPIYYLSGAAAKRDGDHSHDAWHVRVVHESIPGYSIPMIVKSVPSQVTLAVEVACGLAARELRLNVPQPGLVVAEREDLPDIDEGTTGQRLLLVGSHYQRPDALFAEAVENSSAAEEMVWSKLCATAVAKQGAVFDELIANPDRHCENVLFDGTTWWLFDHDQALRPATDFTARPGDDRARQEVIDHNAAVNQLALELVRRYSKQTQAIMEQCRRLNGSAKRLNALAGYAHGWTHADAQVQHVLQLIAVVLGLISLRLPALAEKLQARIDPGRPTTALWT